MQKKSIKHEAVYLRAKSLLVATRTPGMKAHQASVYRTSRQNNIPFISRHRSKYKARFNASRVTALRRAPHASECRSRSVFGTKNL